MKRTLSWLPLFTTFVLCIAGPPTFGQETEERQFSRERVPEEERFQEAREQKLVAGQLRFPPQKPTLHYITTEMKKNPPIDPVQIRMQAASGATIPLGNFGTARQHG